MKKTMSTAALGLRLTAGPVLGMMVLMAAAQALLFWRSQPMWIQENAWENLLFELVIDSEGIAFVGRMGFVNIFCMMVVACNSGKYTVRRLRVTETHLSVVWGLVFAGWMLIMWGLQVAVILVFYGIFAAHTGAGPMTLFLAAYRSTWLHTLLPLAEGWGYVRNVAVCLGWGMIGSLVARYMRHGGKPWMPAVLFVVTGWMIPWEMASLEKDIALMVLLAALAGWMVMVNLGGEEDED